MAQQVAASKSCQNKTKTLTVINQRHVNLQTLPAILTGINVNSTATYSMSKTIKQTGKIMQQTQYSVTTFKHVNGTGSNSTVVTSGWIAINLQQHS